jgi:membrane protease YdiL (CAAX protease family)
MSSDLASATDTPAWLWWAGAAAIAACLGVAGLLVGRLRSGRPLLESRPQRPVPWGGGDVALILLIGLSVALAVGGTLGPDPPLDAQLAGNVAFVSLATLAAIGWLAARGATAADLGLAPVRLADDGRLAMAGVALVVPPLLALAAMLNLLVPYTHPVVEFLAARRDATAVGLVVGTAVLAAPVAEEFFFRRVLQGWLEKLLPDADGGLAITISAAAFALAHQGQGLAFVPLFPLGLVLGFIARRTGSIVPCILLHALFNAVSVGLLLAEPPRVAAS